MGKPELICDCEIIHKEIVNTVKKQFLDENTLILMSNFYKAFADSTRIKIINALSIHKMCVCDIAALLNMTKSTVSHQLKYLKKNKIISSQKQGKIVFYSLADSHVEKMFKICYEHIKEDTL